MIKAFTYSIKEIESKQICNKLPTLIREQTDVYLEVKSLKEEIVETEVRLARLISCIESAESNIVRLKEVDQNEPEEIEFATEECKKINSLVRSSISLDKLLTKIVVNEEVNTY